MESFKPCYMVYETSDYSLFKNLEQNRDVTRIRRDRLIESFKQKEIKNPIVVNCNMEIIDGQGRFEAKKELGLPIQFVVDDSANIDDCRRMNQYNSSWNTDDFVHSYAEGGYESFVRIERMQKEFSVSARKILLFANLPGARYEFHQLIRSGSLMFTEKDENTARKNMKMYDDVVNALCIKASGIRDNASFARALIVCFSTEGYSHKDFVANCASCKERFSMMSSLEDNLKQFSKIYNYRAKQRQRIYFEDYMRNKGRNIRSYPNSFQGREDALKSVKTLGGEK